MCLFGTELIVCKGFQVSLFSYSMNIESEINFKHDSTFSFNSESRSARILYSHGNIHFVANCDEKEFILVGTSSTLTAFRSSLNWLYIDDYHKISHDKVKTKLFQQFCEKNIANGRVSYHGFCSVICNNYLFLFGGMVNLDQNTNLIYYFDFKQMKWFKSKQAKFISL